LRLGRVGSQAWARLAVGWGRRRLKGRVLRRR